MNEVFYNTKSGVERDPKRKYKLVTFRILESEFAATVERLGITATPLRQRKVDLTKGVEVRNMCEYQNEESPIETNPCFKVVFPTDEDRVDFRSKLGVPVTPTTRSLG